MQSLDRGASSPQTARKAAQDPDSQTVFVAIAESADPEGIVVNYLDHSFTPAWLFFVS